MHIGIIVGSLSRESINRRLALALAPRFEAQGATVTQIPIDALPMYNRDIEDPMPEAVAEYHAAIDAQDGIVFVTPEYNRTFSSAMKNATEWGARPPASASLPGKPAAVTGATPGRLLTIGAQQHLRANLSAIGMPVAPAELYVQFDDNHFSADGSIADTSTQDSTDRWVEKVIAHFKALSA